MKDFVIKPGLYTQFKCGQRAEGLHLNRLIEDVMRENGYPTKSSDCTQPDLCELVAPCLSEIPGGTGVTEFTELTDTPNNYSTSEGATLVADPDNNQLIYGPTIRQTSGLDVFNVNFGGAAPTWTILPHGVTRIGGQIFANYQIVANSFSSAGTATMSMSFSATQPNLSYTPISSATVNAHINGVGTNTAIPVTITRQGGTVGSFTFQLTFNAPLGGVVIFVSIQAGI